MPETERGARKNGSPYRGATRRLRLLLVAWIVAACASEAPEASSRPNAGGPNAGARPAQRDGGREIAVDFGRRTPDPKRSMFGLNHGLKAKRPSDEWLQPLPIAYYRDGQALWASPLMERMLERPDTIVHVSLFPGSHPWWDRQRHGNGRRPFDPHGKGHEDWSTYDAYLNAVVTGLASRPRWVSALKEGRIVLGPWNEPINNLGDYGDRPGKQYFYGSREQFFATFKRAHDAIRARFPEAKICGPSYGTNYSFDDHLEEFMTWARGAGIRLDALCVHAIANTPVRFPEFEEKLPELRRKYLESPEWRSLGVQEIHVDENLHGANARNPANILGMLAWLERAGADYATKNSGKSYGWNGSLSGLVNEDQQPVAAYWVPYTYGKMLTGRRLFKGPIRRVDGIAAVDANGVGRAVFGYMGKEDKSGDHDVPVRLSGLDDLGSPPYTVRLEVLEYGGDSRAAQLEPKRLWERTVSDAVFVFDHVVTMHDVYIVTAQAADR